MPRSLLVPVSIALAVALGAAAVVGIPPPREVGGPAAVRPDADSAEDPFPIRRLRASESQLPELLKQFDAGPLTRLPRDEFEERVRGDARALADARVVPRITGAEFTAALVDGDLVGTAKLHLTNPSPGPRFLPLEPLRIAPGRATWGDGREAILGVPAGGTAAAVWVDRPGRQALRFGWSATGTTEPGERRFELRLPAAPTATLDLELPAGQVPTAASGVLLTGPFPVMGDPPRSRWQFRFGGRVRLEFAVRPAGNPGMTAAAALVARYEITPAQLACTFEYDLHPAKGTVGEWAFAIGPGLRITDVVVNNRAAWTVEQPTGPGEPRILRVTLRQPGAGGKVLIAAVAPFPDPSAPNATLPVVRPVGGDLDDELLEIRLAPRLKPDFWNPGDYRLTDSQLLPDRTRVLNLTGTLLPPGPDRQFRRPPTLRAAAADVSFATTEQVTWRFDSGRAVAVVRVGLRVRRGPLFQFALKPPMGYALGRVSSAPDELVAYSGLVTGTVTVEFARPLLTGQTAELTFEFRGPPLVSGTNRLPFPAFTPVGASERVGVLCICPGSKWEIDAQPGAGCTRAGWLDFTGPAPAAGAAAAFRYRGGDPDGWVTLTPVRTDPATPTGQRPGAGPTPDSPAASWAFTGLYLVSAVRSLSDVLVVFGGTATSPGDRVLRIRLPAGAELRSAGVGGRWLDPGGCHPDADGAVSLPCPGAGPVRFEVRYRLPVGPGGPIRTIRSPEPGLPGDAGEYRRWWAFAPEVLPGWPVRAWERGTTADLPTLMGDSPVCGSDGVVVSRSPVEEVRVASTRLARAIGIGIAGLLVALAWVAVRRRYPAFGLLTIGGLFAVGVISLLGPPWWQRAAAAPLVAGLVSAAVMVIARGHRSLAPVGAGLILPCLLPWSASVAQPPAPAVVVILSDAEGRETVVAPKAVLDRLAALTRPASPGVVLTAAEYVATVDEAAVRVTAKFTVHALGDGESVATLPLADARLEQVNVGKKAAFPTSPRPGVYAIPLPDKGRHEVEVRFAAPVTGTGTEREFRFGVPECPFTRVTTDLPGSARQVQTVGRLGRQVTSTGERVRVEADVGAVKAVQVRWRDRPAGPAVVRVREGCVWDVTEAGAELTACYLVRAEQGTVSALRFDVPAELDTLGVVVRPLEPGATAALSDWSVGKEQNGFRPLRIDLQGPTSGRLLVILTCGPRKQVTRQPVLRFPRVVVPGPKAEPDAAYALRTKGVVIEELPRSWVIDFTPDGLTRDFAAIPELRLDPAAPIRVFRPTPGGVPDLRPTLRVAAEPPALAIDTTWHVGPNRADAAGTLHWTGKDTSGLLEFTVPGVKVLEVRGPDVTGWSQVAGRVQVWLRRLAREGELEWSGIAIPAPLVMMTPLVTLDAATPKPLDARLVSERLRVRPADGWGLRVERDRGWTVGTAGPDLTFRATNPSAPPVRVLLVPAPRVGRISDDGWLSPWPRPAETAIIPPREETAKPTPLPVPPAEWAAQLWVWPVSAAVAWGIGVAGLAVLLARFPCSTWPEQVGLVGALFGAAVVGQWWVGLAAWGVARLVWLAERALQARRSSAAA